MIYRFDIYYDCTRPKGDRFYNMSNPKRLDSRESLLSEMKSMDNDGKGVLDFDYYMSVNGYVFYNRVDLKETGEKGVLKIKTRIGVDYSFDKEESYLSTSHINRWEELNVILESIQREEKINSLFL